VSEILIAIKCTIWIPSPWLCRDQASSLKKEKEERMKDYLIRIR
jgi:hypothetical protein